MAPFLKQQIRDGFVAMQTQDGFGVIETIGEKCCLQPTMFYCNFFWRTSSFPRPKIFLASTIGGFPPVKTGFLFHAWNKGRHQQRYAKSKQQQENHFGP